jgi:predicted metalloprotease
MRWSDLGRSKNLEDERGSSGFGLGHLGVGGVLVVVVFALLTHQNPIDLLRRTQQADPAAQQAPPVNDAAQEPEVRFVSFVLDTAQQTWSVLVPAMGTSWHDAKLVLFRDQYGSGCGDASAATGPFYCPTDEKVYIDLGFFDELKTRFGAPGEFAQAYVLAHELGHHVQKLLGVERSATSAETSHPGQANQISVAIELQADCYAGVWAHTAAREGIVQAGDIDQGLAAAAAVGDDRLQRMSGQAVQPETWTHGSSAQRTHWFRTGFDSGDPKACDTFTRSVPQ